MICFPLYIAALSFVLCARFLCLVGIVAYHDTWTRYFLSLHFGIWIAKSVNNFTIPLLPLPPLPLPLLPLSLHPLLLLPLLLPLPTLLPLLLLLFPLVVVVVVFSVVDVEQVELDAAGNAQRKVVGEFKERLARIIERNETLPELEKMDRSEFVVDVAGRYVCVPV